MIVAGRDDDAAHVLRERWSDVDVAVLTAVDLSTPGWWFQPARPGSGRCVAGGRLLEESQLEAVLVRLPWITASELSWVCDADREYAAAEMSAFLVAWLGSLPCRVINRATPGSLCGVAWSPLRWVQEARRAGLPVRRVAAASSPEAPFDATALPRSAWQLTVVGDHVVGDAPPGFADAARRLAAAAAVEVLVLEFQEARGEAVMAYAHPFADVWQPPVADAIRAVLLVHAA